MDIKDDLTLPPPLEVDSRTQKEKPYHNKPKISKIFLVVMEVNIGKQGCGSGLRLPGSGFESDP